MASSLRPSSSRLPSADIVDNSFSFIFSSSNSPSVDSVFRPNHFRLAEHIASLTGEHAYKIKLGFLLWLERDIKYREYGGRAPYWVLWPSTKVWGSKTYHALDQRLSLFQSDLTPRDRAIFLSSFEQYMTQNDGANLQNLNLTHLRTFIDFLPSISEVEYQAHRTFYDGVLGRTPAPGYLLREFAEINDAYLQYYLHKNIVANVLHDPERDFLVLFLTGFNNRLNLDRVDPSTVTRDHPQFQLRWKAAVFIMNEINTTYKLWPSDCSGLFKICANVTNVNDLSRFSAQDKYKIFLELHAFIQKELEKTDDALNTAWSPMQNVKLYLTAINLKLMLLMAEMQVINNSEKKSDESYFEVVRKYCAELPRQIAESAASVSISTLVSSLLKRPIQNITTGIGTYLGGPLGGLVGYYSGSYLARDVISSRVSSQIVTSATRPSVLVEAHKRLQAKAKEREAIQKTPQVEVKLSEPQAPQYDYTDSTLRDSLYVLFPGKRKVINKVFDVPLADEDKKEAKQDVKQEKEAKAKDSSATSMPSSSSSSSAPSVSAMPAVELQSLSDAPPAPQEMEGSEVEDKKRDVTVRASSVRATLHSAPTQQPVVDAPSGPPVASPAPLVLG